MEALDHTIQGLEQGEITAIEAIDALLSEEYVTRESRRIDVALRTAKLMDTSENARFCRDDGGQTWRTAL